MCYLPCFDVDENVMRKESISFLDWPTGYLSWQLQLNIQRDYDGY